MSDTPRTDAEIIFPGGGIVMVRPEFARQLEAELAAAKQELESVHNVLAELANAGDAYSGSYDPAEQDDVAVMLRFGHATDAARDAIRERTK